MRHSHARVWVEVNLSTLRQNFIAICARVAPLKVTAVLKANAYGLGVRPIAEALKVAGVEGFAVAEINEALQLKSLGLPIQILGGILEDEIELGVAQGFILPVGDLQIAKKVEEEAVKQGVIVPVQLPVDTAMGRVGVLHSRANAFIDELLKLKHLKLMGIYSHFPIAYESASEMSHHQCDLLEKIVGYAESQGVVFERIHIANSDAINNLPFACSAPFTHVRTGINLHGSFDPMGQRALKLASILTLKTRLIAIKELPAHYTIGYGCTLKLAKNTLVGTISAGYADGLPLALSNRGYVLINGVMCPILGRISMDYTTVDLSPIPDAQLGDEVICLGGEGVNAISVEYWAGLKNTHAYEIICSLGNRVERCYLN